MRRIIRNTVRALGFDVVRYNASPGATLLGLSALNVGTVIDVGANTGQFARGIIEKIPGIQMFCFEPLEEPFAELDAWAQTQDGRVACYQVALSDAPSLTTIRHHVHHSPSSSLLSATELSHQLYPQTKGERVVEIAVSTLDDVLADQLATMRKELFLKLDVQGLEDRVLRGGSRVLGECAAVLLEVCLMPLYEGQAQFEALVRLMSSQGFSYSGNLDQTYDAAGRVVFIDAMFTRE